MKGVVMVCSFLGRYSHLGPQDDGQAESSKRYIVYNDILQYNY